MAEMYEMLSGRSVSSRQPIAPQHNEGLIVMAEPTELDRWIQRIVYEQYAITEQQLRALVRPKPRWMPKRIWMWLLKLLLVLEITER